MKEYMPVYVTYVHTHLDSYIRTYDQDSSFKSSINTYVHPARNK